jgi:hypothetical protein
MEKYYESMVTGEITDSHRKAMEWFRKGDDISIYSYSEKSDKWIFRLRWEH